MIRNEARDLVRVVESRQRLVQLEAIVPLCRRRTGMAVLRIRQQSVDMAAYALVGQQGGFKKKLQTNNV